MTFQFKDLQHHGGLYPLLPHLSKFFWLHPRLTWMNPDLESSLYPALNFGVKEGLLIKCRIEPWYAPSPSLLDRLRGIALSRLQWKMLMEGPPAHTSMIHRVAFPFRQLPESFFVEIDEGVKERSPPSGWGGFSERVPDILVRAPSDIWPSLWIECERTIKSDGDYERKLKAIGRKAFVLYVTPHEKTRLRLMSKWPAMPGTQKRIRLMTEVGAMAWFRAYSLYVRRCENDQQLPLSAQMS